MIPEAQTDADDHEQAPSRDEAKTDPGPSGDPANQDAPTGPTTNTDDERQALYQSCLSRVEGTESAGECKTDSDCAKAGCSSEVCVSATEAANVMTTCEIKPCFRVLRSCTCQEGRCRWVLGDRGGPSPVQPKLDVQ